MNDPVNELYRQYPYPPPGRAGRMWKKRFEKLVVEGEALASRLLKAGAELGGGRLLDAGCGTGAKTLGLARALPDTEVLGVDGSEPSLAFAEQALCERGAGNGTVRRMDLEQDDLASLGSFQAVVSDGVVHHLADPDEAVRRLALRVAPGGAFYLSVFSRVGRPREGRIREMQRLAGSGEDDLKKGIRLIRALLGLPDLVNARHAKYYEDDAFLADAFLNPREACFDIPWIAARFEASGLVFRSWPEGTAHLRPLTDALLRGGTDPSSLTSVRLYHLVELWKAPAMISGLGVRERSDG